MATNVPLAPYNQSALTADGSSTGTVSVASTQPFRAGARVWLGSTTVTPVELIVDEIVSATVLALRDPRKIGSVRFPANAYLVADGAALTQNVQPDFLAANWA